jgi:hypothetical protein
VDKRGITVGFPVRAVIYFPEMSRLALGHTAPYCVSEALSLVVKWPGREANRSSVFPRLCTISCTLAI